MSSRRFTSSAFLKCLPRRHRTTQSTREGTRAPHRPPYLAASNSLRALPRMTSRHVSPRSLRHTNRREARSTCSQTVLRGTSRACLTRPPRRRTQAHRSIQRQRVATSGEHNGRVAGPRLDLQTTQQEGASAQRRRQHDTRKATAQQCARASVRSRSSSISLPSLSSWTPLCCNTLPCHGACRAHQARCRHARVRRCMTAINLPRQSGEATYSKRRQRGRALRVQIGLHGFTACRAPPNSW